MITAHVERGKYITPAQGMYIVYTHGGIKIRGERTRLNN